MPGKDQHKNLPSDEELLRLVDRDGPTATAVAFGVSRGAIANRVARIRKAKAEIERPGTSFHDDGTATVVSEADLPKGWTPEEILADANIDPAEHVVQRVRVNRWGTEGEPRFQVRVDVIPKKALICIPDPGKWKAPKPRKNPKRDKGREVGIVCGDHHAPHHDPDLHALFLEALREIQPDFIEINGDLLDFATISKHRPSISGEYNESVNECLQAGFQILADYRDTAPNARIRLKRGNHDERLHYQIVDQLAGLAGITAADEEVPALSLRNLLHLDRLHIEYVDEEWSLAKTRITKKLTVRHGTSTSKNAPEEMLAKLGNSSIQGHTHRISARYRVEWNDAAEDEPEFSVRGAFEHGTMATIKGGLGYIPGGEPQWQNGFLVVHTWPDGRFTVAPAVYVPGCLLLPDGSRYEK